MFTVGSFTLTLCNTTITAQCVAGIAFGGQRSLYSDHSKLSDTVLIELSEYINVRCSIAVQSVAIVSHTAQWYWCTVDT